jgi:hypothetical protein
LRAAVAVSGGLFVALLIIASGDDVAGAEAEAQERLLSFEEELLDFSSFWQTDHV